MILEFSAVKTKGFFSVDEVFFGVLGNVHRLHMADEFGILSVCLCVCVCSSNILLSKILKRLE